MKKDIYSEWILANAGSGKTTTLTDRVVRLLLLGVTPERIVCITYTKAAAAEMRERVLMRLRSLLLMDEAAARAEIEKQVGEPATDEMLTRARQLFGQVLDSVHGGVMLTTIHGFCQHILRRFPLEAGLSPHFTVLEDEAVATLVAGVKHTLLSGLAEADPALQQALALIGARAGEYGFDSMCADILNNRRVWEELLCRHSADALRSAVYAQHGLAADASREALAEALCQALSPAQEAAIRRALPVMQTHTKKTEQKYAHGLAQWLAAKNRAEHIAAVLALLLKKEDGNIRSEIAKLEAAAEIMPLADAAQRYAQQAAALACAEESLAVATLARALLGLYASAKASHAALDYDDLIMRTLTLVSHPDTLGWVMSKLDHRIDHLLIDEAQDNSAAQWQLAHVLVEELMASGGGIGSANVPRSLLVVGDEKQSIYSFQGAAPEQFHHYQRGFAALLAQSSAPLVDRALETSYRSGKAVLDLVDQVCAQPEMARALSNVGVIHPHVLHRTNVMGQVILHPPITAPEREKTPPLTIPREYTITRSAAQLVAEQVVGQVVECMEAGIRAGEVLILVHKRKPLVPLLIRALERRGIPVAGIDRLMLSEHLAVQDILALIGWCLHPADDLALAQVLRSPLVGISDEELRAHAFGRTGSLWQVVAGHYPWLSEARAEARTATPYAFLTWVLEVCDTRRGFARRFGQEVHEVLDELKAQAAAMPRARPNSLAQFHERMMRSTRHIKREQETSARDEVRIMTVHGSKGLEARVVMLADTVNVPTTQRERIFFLPTTHGHMLPLLALSPEGKKAPRLEEAKQRKKSVLLEEYNRLLYVALTRARDALHLFGQSNQKGEVKSGAWYAHVAEAMRTLGQEQADGRWVLGEGISVPPRGETDDGGRSLEIAASPCPAELPSWLFSTVSKATAPTTLAPSQAYAPSPYLAAAGGTTRERGVRIHKLLELMRAQSDADEVAALLTHLALEWSPRERAQVVAEVMALHTREPWLWQGTRRAEASISGMVDGAMVHGQIDLMIETPETITVIDYKTGRQIPKTAEDVPEPYRAQLRLYARLLAGIYPKRTIRSAIVWTYGPRLMWVKW